MNHKKIGVQNFRVFKDYTEFKLKPITLLTGPNNSGKSSFSKLLLLLKNGIQNLNFTSGSHNLESFEKILNWDSEKESIVLEFHNTIPILNKSFNTQFEISQNELSGITIKSPKDILLSVDFEEDRSMIEYGSINFFQNVNLNIQYLINLIYKKEILVPIKNSRNNKVYDQKSWRTLNTIKIPSSRNYLSLSELKDHLSKKVKFGEQTYAYQIRNETLVGEIDSLPKDFLLYDISIFGAPISDDQKEIIAELQKNIFSNLVLSNSFGMRIGSKDFKKNYCILIENINFQAKMNLLDEIKNYFGVDDVSIRESLLGRLIFEELTFKDSFENFKSNPHPIDEKEINRFENIRFLEPLFYQFKDLKFDLEDYLDEIHYISPSRGNQQRVLMNSSENEIDELVLQFSKLHKSNQNLPFLEEALKILGIEGDLKIERFENFISVISLIKDGKKITLADLGYGYSQIIPIILKIILVNQGFYPTATLIIEEPEANLHPDLQSKLADILSLSLKTFSGTYFILETHSEYLIRKLQFLTSKKELSPEQSIIYYFNADKYVSHEEPKVKKIEITPTGNLTDTFGPGFYDEATRLQFDLLKINREQTN